MALVWQPTRFQCVYFNGVPLLPLLQRLLRLLLLSLWAKTMLEMLVCTTHSFTNESLLLTLFLGHTQKKLKHSMANATKKMHQTFVYRSRHNSNALRSHVPFTYIATELKLGRALIRPPSRWLAHTSAHAHYTTIDTYETFFSLPFQMIQTQCAPIFLSMRNRNGCVQVYSDVTQFYLCNPILCARNNLYWSLDSQKCINCKHFINKKNYGNNIFYIYHEINCIRWIK